MSWDRADAATYLASTLGARLMQASIGNEDEIGELKEPIDDALLLMSVAEDDLETATIADTFGFRRVLRATTLQRISDGIGPRANLSAGSTSVSYGNADATRADELKRAWLDAEPFITATTSNVYAMTSINYDFIEPMVTP